MSRLGVIGALVFTIFAFQNCDGENHKLMGDFEKASFVDLRLPENIFATVEGTDLKPQGAEALAGVLRASECIVQPLGAEGDAEVLGLCLDGDASAGLYTDNDVVIPDTGDYKIRVYAAGVYVNNSWSTLSLTINGMDFGTVDITSRNPAHSYLFRTRIAVAGLYKLQFRFMNDFKTSGENKNLFINRVEIEKEKDLPL